MLIGFRRKQDYKNLVNKKIQEKRANIYTVYTTTTTNNNFSYVVTNNTAAIPFNNWSDLVYNREYLSALDLLMLDDLEG